MHVSWPLLKEGAWLPAKHLFIKIILPAEPAHGFTVQYFTADHTFFLYEDVTATALGIGILGDRSEGKFAVFSLIS